MASRQAGSPATRVMQSPMYRNGKRFTAKEMADAVDVPLRIMSSALRSMRDRNDIVSLRDGRYHKPEERHLIHTIRLSNPVYDSRRDNLI